MNLPRLHGLAVLPLAAVLACRAGSGPPGSGLAGQGRAATVRGADPANPADPTVLVYGRSSDSVTLDPAAASDTESAKVIDCIFDTLTDFADDPDAPARIVPGLATEWRHSADRMTWTFTLRRDARFHDGRLVDARAVKFSLDRLVDPADPYAPARVPYRSTFRNIKEIEVLGPYELQIRLSEPSIVLLPNLAMFTTAIVSPAAVKTAGRDFGRKPVGSGPFGFRSWTPGRISLAANDEWWVERRSGIRRLVFVAVPDPARRRAMLERGELHVADDLGPADEQALARSPGTRFIRSRSMNVCYLAMNNEAPPLDDPALRRAIAQCIDRKRILREGYAGLGEVAGDLLPASIAGGQESILPVRNVAAAKALVAKGGWTDRAPLALWYMKGQRPYLMDPERVARIVSESLRAIGLAVEVRSFAWPVYRAKLKAGEHQLALMGWTTDNGDPDNFYTPLLSEASIGATNYVRLHSARFETLLAASREEADRTYRAALFRGMQKLLHRLCPVVPLVHSDLALALSDDVQGFRPHPIKLRLYGVSRVAKKK